MQNIFLYVYIRLGEYFGGDVSYIQAVKFIIIALIVVAIVTYIGVITWQNKNYQIQIAELSKQIAMADTMIDNQNAKIEELQINIQEKSKQYKIAEQNIQKYKQEKLEYIKILDNATCEERMNYILQLQKEFQYAK